MVVFQLHLKDVLWSPDRDIKGVYFRIPQNSHSVLKRMLYLRGDVHGFLGSELAS